MSIPAQVEKSTSGIWRYRSYYPFVPKEYRLSLNEGETPEVKSEGIIFKREDQNPTGSLKDRGMTYQISQALAEGEEKLVISSSGNAGISAAAYCRLAEIKLHVFVSPKIKSEKLKQIKKFGAEVYLSMRPVSEAIRFSQKTGFLNLRPSVQDNGLIGYKSLAFEIHQNLGKVDSIFIPVSSGTALVGMAEGYKTLGYLPQLHLVQTTVVCPLAGLFDKDYQRSKTSLADALVARIVPRKKEILKLVEDSGGWGWVISDEQIEEAAKKLENLGISTSAEGEAALAAIWKAKKKGKDLGEKVVCLLTGKKY